MKPIPVGSVADISERVGKPPTLSAQAVVDALDEVGVRALVLYEHGAGSSTRRAKMKKPVADALGHARALRLLLDDPAVVRNLSAEAWDAAGVLDALIAALEYRPTLTGKVGAAAAAVEAVIGSASRNSSVVCALARAYWHTYGVSQPFLEPRGIVGLHQDRRPVYIDGVDDIEVTYKRAHGPLIEFVLVTLDLVSDATGLADLSSSNFDPDTIAEYVRRGIPRPSSAPRDSESDKFPSGERNPPDGRP